MKDLPRTPMMASALLTSEMGLAFTVAPQKVGLPSLLKRVAHSASPTLVGLATLYNVLACPNGNDLFAHPQKC